MRPRFGLDALRGTLIPNNINKSNIIRAGSNPFLEQLRIWHNQAYNILKIGKSDLDTNGELQCKNFLNNFQSVVLPYNPTPPVIQKMAQ